MKMRMRQKPGVFRKCMVCRFHVESREKVAKSFLTKEATYIDGRKARW